MAKRKTANNQTPAGDVVALVYPHHLFADHPALHHASSAWLVEDPLYFTQYHFHRQKLIYHRATMAEYAHRLNQLGVTTRIIACTELADSRDIGRLLREHKKEHAVWVEPSDDWLSRRVLEGCRNHDIKLTTLPDESFLTPMNVIEAFSAKHQSMFFSSFYIEQRKRLGVLLDRAGKPIGGKWSFDPENRRKLPKGLSIPNLPSVKQNETLQSASKSVDHEFPNAPGTADAPWLPTNHESAMKWLKRFVEERLASFGDFEDAMTPHGDVLFHSVLTPMLNVGLLTPDDVLSAVLQAENVPINSLEGFVRQVIGWREFIRLVYLTRGRVQRTSNAWNHHRSMPKSFYTGDSGIVPVDVVIKRVLRLGYCHHIERLMVLGNFFMLCEIDPKAVYQWFMELFVDAYDWVMVPNVFGMSQHADGGLMTTKPYISSSNYILKMSHFSKDDWCPIWDGLYWRFVAKHREFFEGNPRLSVMTKQLDKMGDKLKVHQTVAEEFLANLR